MVRVALRANKRPRSRRRCSLQELTVDVKVDPLGVEAEETGDVLTLGQRHPVWPGHIGVDYLAKILCRAGTRHALVRAVAGGLCRCQEMHADVRLRQVEADGEAGLEEEARLRRLGDGYSVDFNPDVSRARQDLDAL